MTSRIFGLFPYLDYDEYGICHMHKSLDSDSGCYGKIVPSLRIPAGVSLIVDDNVLVQENETYSYRTLLNYYYQYKDLTDSTFIIFFNEGIGRFEIDAEEEWDLVPSYEYYANSGRLYNEYSRIKTSCDNYLAMRDISGENCQMECLVEKYRRMGGDEMMDFYHEKYEEMIEKSEYFYTLGDVEDTYININLSIVTNENDLGVRTPCIDYWQPGIEYMDGQTVIYNDRSYICNTDNSGSVWDSTIEEYVFDENSFDLIGETNENVELNGETDSRLKSFRITNDYVNIGGNEQHPDYDKDWLWYYKVGTITAYESITDEYGNIVLDENGTRTTNIGDTQDNLLAYGNVLTDISINDTDRTITFTYVIGANLVAELSNIEAVDGTRNDKRYYYTNFRYNENDTTHGVVFVETYQYEEDGEIDYFYNLDSNVFDYFIGKNNNTSYENDLYVYHSDIDNCLAYAKCEFSLQPNIGESYALVDGVETLYNYVISEYTANAQSNLDIISVPTFSEEKYVGISYTPEINADIYINRGNAASWERHMKLSEVKSFDDLENYANGRYFNLL